MEFLVHMKLHLPDNWGDGSIKNIYAREAEAAKPYLDSGQMARVWREPGTRNHYALWDVADAQVIHDAYTSFPMFRWMDVTVTALCTNPNDPGTPYAGCDGLMFTWADLNRYYEQQIEAGRFTLPGERRLTMHEGETVILDADAGISVHKHPGSAYPEEFHLMVGDVKVAEIGPDENAHGEGKAPRYVDILAEWDGAPVMWRKVKARVMDDNNSLHPDYKSALHGPRASF